MPLAWTDVGRRLLGRRKFVGSVSIVNNSDVAKPVPEGEVTGDIDLTDA